MMDMVDLYDEEHPDYEVQHICVGTEYAVKQIIGCGDYI